MRIYKFYFVCKQWTKAYSTAQYAMINYRRQWRLNVVTIAIVNVSKLEIWRNVKFTLQTQLYNCKFLLNNLTHSLACIEDWLLVKTSCPSCRKALTLIDLVPNVPIQRYNY